jgi:hypothetical protein
MPMHDGLLAEVPRNRAEEAASVLLEAFKTSATWVPLLGLEGAVKSKVWADGWHGDRQHHGDRQQGPRSPDSMEEKTTPPGMTEKKARE